MSPPFHPERAGRVRTHDRSSRDGTPANGAAPRARHFSDKRLSSIVTCLVAVAGQFAYHWLTTAYYLPMFELFRKLG